jgi:hypothetical protein
LHARIPDASGVHSVLEERREERGERREERGERREERGERREERREKWSVS